MGSDGSVVEDFLEYQPSVVDNFRGIVLFGRNVASYKFALAHSLIDLARQQKTRVSLPELAVPFSAHLAAHLQQAPRQTTSPSSKFLDACRQYNEGALTHEGLIDATVRLGFNNVIDAFHVVERQDVGDRFFIDERRTAGGIVLTDAVDVLAADALYSPADEIESRWRLVESAWDLGLNTSLIRVDEDLSHLVTADRRRSITNARHALNGYQKGVCFYCYCPIGIRTGDADLAEVDHVFPHVLQRRRILPNLDAVWNLVLACTDCNRGEGGKSASVPALDYVRRLHRRNEYLIGSAHPLRETLMLQTGPDTRHRSAFLQASYNTARESLLRTWHTEERGHPRF